MLRLFNSVNKDTMGTGGQSHTILRPAESGGVILPDNPRGGKELLVGHAL